MQAIANESVETPILPVADTTEAVNAVIAKTAFADSVVLDIITNAANKVDAYSDFRIWATNVAAKVEGGEAAVVRSEYAAAAYLLGAETLLENAPVIEFSEVKVDDGANVPGDKGTITLSVTVKDGQNAVAVASEKVKAMFEATSDLDAVPIAKSTQR